MFLLKKRTQSDSEHVNNLINHEAEQLVYLMPYVDTDEMMARIKLRLYELHKPIVDRISRRYCYSLGGKFDDDIISVANLAMLTIINNPSSVLKTHNNITPRLVYYIHSKIYSFLLKELRLTNRRILIKTGLLAGKSNQQINHALVVMELNELLEKCLLTHTDKKIFEYIYAGYTMQEIAKKMKLHYSSVRTIVATIRRRFRRLNNA